MAESQAWMKLKDAVAGGKCPFCGTLLGATTEKPENIAFLRHIEGRFDCKKAFDAWREHTAQDAGGD